MLTVRDLAEALAAMPQDARVFVTHDEGVEELFRVVPSQVNATIVYLVAVDPEQDDSPDLSK